MTDPATVRQPTRAARVRGWVGRVLAWTVILGAFGALLVAVVVPRLEDATPYAVLTGSMRPSLPEGTLVVVRPTRPESVGIGTLITYQIHSGQPTVVTHRVVAQSIDGNGSRVFRTRGDANDVEDAGWVKPVQIKGEVWYAVPQVGRAHALLSRQEHQLAVYVVVAGLLGYAVFMFTGALRQRRTPRLGEAT